MTVNRIIYVGMNRLNVSIYDGRAFLGEFAFVIDESGGAAFSDSIRREPGIPTAVIVDMIEEEYRNETIPHLLGGDRRTVIARKLEQVFRATPYRVAQLQGRQKDGRRDDRVLLTALTNPDALAACLAPLEECKTPVAGVYSIPMLATTLLQRLGIKGDNVLLLTRNRQGELRQTFVHRHELRNSRLSPPGTLEHGPALLAQEVEKNRRYLNRLRVLDHGAVLDVAIVADAALIADLRAVWRDTESLRYHLVALEDAAAAIGMTATAGTPDSERLFVHLLSRSAPKVNYAQPVSRRGFLHYRTRTAMFAAGIVLTLGGAVWAGMNILDGYALEGKRVAAERGIESLRADYAAAAAGQPKMDVDVEQMRWMVDAGDTIRRSNATPWSLLQAISAGVSAHPAIRIDEVNWDSTYQDGEIAPENLLSDTAPAAAGSAEQNAIVKGQVSDFNGDLRAAFTQVEEFMATLRDQGRFSVVKAVAMPLNIDPAATVAGMAGRQSGDEKAGFEIRVVFRGAV